MDSLNVYFTGVNQVEVRTEAVREPGPSEVVIRTAKTLISTGTECICLGHLFESGSHWDKWIKYPFSPGYSLAGTVHGVGSEVEGFNPGDRVAARANHRQYAVTNVTRIVRIPNSVTDEDATWFGLANIVQNGVRRAEHVMGESVVVIGLGILGQLAVDPAEKRLEMARNHGATHTIAVGAGDAIEEALRLTGGAGADVVYDVTGHSAVFVAALKMAKRFGRVIILGDTGSPSEQRLTSDVITRGLRIIGAHDNNPPLESTDHAYWSHAKMAELLFTYLARGDIRVSDLVTHRYSPVDAPESYRMLREERESAMGVVFEWDRL